MVPGSYLLQLRILFLAYVHGIGASWIKATALRRVEKVGRLARN